MLLPLAEPLANRIFHHRRTPVARREYRMHSNRAGYVEDRCKIGRKISLWIGWVIKANAGCNANIIKNFSKFTQRQTWKPRKTLAAKIMSHKCHHDWHNSDVPRCWCFFRVNGDKSKYFPHMWAGRKCITMCWSVWNKWLAIPQKKLFCTTKCMCVCAVEKFGRHNHLSVTQYWLEKMPPKSSDSANIVLWVRITDYFCIIQN